MIKPSASRNLILEIEISGNSVCKIAITCPMLRVGCRRRVSDAGDGELSTPRRRGSAAAVTGESAGFGIMRAG